MGTFPPISYGHKAANPYSRPDQDTDCYSQRVSYGYQDTGAPTDGYRYTRHTYRDQGGNQHLRTPDRDHQANRHAGSGATHGHTRADAADQHTCAGTTDGHTGAGAADQHACPGDADKEATYQHPLAPYEHPNYGDGHALVARLRIHTPPAQQSRKTIERM